jgi:hypothetical protein
VNGERAGATSSILSAGSTPLDVADGSRPASLSPVRRRLVR